MLLAREIALLVTSVFEWSFQEQLLLFLLLDFLGTSCRAFCTYVLLKRSIQGAD